MGKRYQNLPLCSGGSALRGGRGRERAEMLSSPWGGGSGAPSPSSGSWPLACSCLSSEVSSSSRGRLSAHSDVEGNQVHILSTTLRVRVPSTTSRTLLADVDDDTWWSFGAGRSNPATAPWQGSQHHCMGTWSPCPSWLKEAGPDDPGGQMPLGLQPITASSLSLARSQAGHLSRSPSQTLAAKEVLNF